MSESSVKKDLGTSSHRKAVTLVNLEYQRHLPIDGVSKGVVAEYQRVSHLRAADFGAAAKSAPGDYGKKIEALSAGFGRVAVLDRRLALEVFEGTLPHSKGLESLTRDLILDLAIMRLRFDEFNIEDPHVMRTHVQTELRSILASLGITNPNQEDSDAPFTPRAVSFEDVIEHALSMNYDLEKLVELQ